jgi:hypothetical protein
MPIRVSTRAAHTRTVMPHIIRHETHQISELTERQAETVGGRHMRNRNDAVRVILEGCCEECQHLVDRGWGRVHRDWNDIQPYKHWLFRYKVSPAFESACMLLRTPDSIVRRT